MRIMFGLPSIDGKYDIQVTRTIAEQVVSMVGSGNVVSFAFIKATMIHDARNIIAKNALEDDMDYVFFVDSDMVLPQHTLIRLLKHDKDIVSGLYFQKYPPHKPVVFKKNDKNVLGAINEYPKDALIDVDGVGMGVCLIKRRVFDALGTKCFDALAKTAEHPTINGEDVAFCYRAAQNGFKICVDTGIQAKHQAVEYIDETHFIKHKETTNGNC